MFLDFLELSKKHNDGWGLAYFYKGNLTLIKEPIEARKSNVAKKFLGTEAEIFLGHLRKASAGENKYVNTHPFVYTLNGREWVFAHNGSLYKKGQDLSKKPFSVCIQGDTDSERFFAYVMDIMKEKGQKNIKNILLEAKNLVLPFQDYAVANKHGGLNFILTNGKDVYIHRKNRTLWYLQKPGKIIICSEPLSRDAWKEFDEDVIYFIKDGIMKVL